jgi:hypothetical protein
MGVESSGTVCRRDNIPPVNCIGGDAVANKHRQTAAKGFRLALLGAFACLFIAGFSLTLIKLMGYAL